MKEDAQSRSMEEHQQAGARKLPAYYTLRIENFSVFKEELNSYESAEFEAGGCKWKLVLYPKGKENRDGKQYISVYLALADNLEANKGVYAVFRLYLLDQENLNDFIPPDSSDEGKQVCFNKSKHEGKQRCFHKLKPEWGFDPFIRAYEFEDPGNGYVVKDAVVLGVEIISVCKEKLTGKGESVLIAKEDWASKFTWTIEKFSKIKEEVIYSKIFSAGEQEWKIELYPNGTGHGEKEHLSLYLSLAEHTAPKGRIYAEVMLRILDQAKERHIIAKDSFWFDESSTRHGWSRFTPHYHLNRSKKFLMVKDVCIVEAEVKVLALAKAL